MSKKSRGFGSDNQSGVHPRIMEKLVEINAGHAVGYGDDEISLEAEEAFKSVFGAQAEVFFVYNGTSANVLAIRCLAESFEAVLCSDIAHIYEDEAGAPEKWTGCKLIPLSHENGKISIGQIEPWLHWKGDVHRVQPRVVSITNATEYGTVYTLEEIREMADFCHRNHLYLHMDGARISNALAGLGADLKDLAETGIDAISFGGTKNGLWAGEALVFLNPKPARHAANFRKQQGQLHSKMRFISAQFIPYLKENLWYKNARHANEMARLLEKEIEKIPEVKICYPVQANGVFASIPEHWNAPLSEKFHFYIFDPSRNMARWMCSWDTQPEDIAAFCQEMERLREN